MRALVDTILACLELLRLAVLSRFRLQGPYWAWRLHTAYGSSLPPRAVLIRDALRFARWARRMRRL